MHYIFNITFYVKELLMFEFNTIGQSKIGFATKTIHHASLSKAKHHIYTRREQMSSQQH
jgi:hypothetical protein